jgi:hypothetical protein
MNVVRNIKHSICPSGIALMTPLGEWVQNTDALGPISRDCFIKCEVRSWTCIMSQHPGDFDTDVVRITSGGL